MNPVVPSSSAQRSALAHIQRRAEDARPAARARIAAILARTGASPSALDVLIAALDEHARTTLNFHPDRLLHDGSTVAENLLAQGRYRNQFETGITSGSRTAFRGGDRDGWEEKLFGGAYQEPAVQNEERPKYGALNLMQHVDGGSPRFGSCFLVLRRPMLERCTFTWGDSHEGPVHVGTLAVPEPLLAALLESVEDKGEALGIVGMDVPALLRFLASPSPGQTAARALDTYIEAQVHSAIDLAADVEALVIDPSFEGTETGVQLHDTAARYGITLRRHPGFTLSAQDVPDDFRGPRMVPLAARVAVGGRLDAAVVGRAAASLHRDPESWTDCGTFDETLQHIKQLWHVLVRYGAPGRDEPVDVDVDVSRR
jgi:Protein of unknown function (DUF3626)